MRGHSRGRLTVERVIVTTLGAAAWVSAILLIVRLRGTTREYARLPVDSGPGSLIADAAARVTGSVCGALVAGVLVLGLGFRFVMSVLAATSPYSAQGRLTEADKVIGQVTVGGTLEIIGFVGLLGGFGGLLLYAILRRWLPDRSLSAGLLTACTGAALVAHPTDLLRPSSTDFQLLAPRWLAVVLIVGLVATFALLAAVLIDRWATTWPRPSLTFRGIASLLPLAPLFLAVTPGAIALLAVGFSAFVSPVFRRPGSLARFDRLARVGVRIGAGVGGAWLLLSAGEIVTG
jgi:hypothetical protein